MSRVPKPCKAGKSGSTTPLHGPYFQTHDWFLKLGGAFSWVRTSEIWQESDATLAPLHSFIPWTWTWTLVQTPCDQFFCSQSIGSLDFGVSVVLDPKVNPPLLILEFRLRPWFKPLPAQHFSTTVSIKWILLFTGAHCNLVVWWCYFPETELENQLLPRVFSTRHLHYSRLHPGSHQ